MDRLSKVYKFLHRETARKRCLRVFVNITGDTQREFVFLVAGTAFTLRLDVVYLESGWLTPSRLRCVRDGTRTIVRLAASKMPAEFISANPPLVKT